jgi:signal transduction histidine kinase
MWAARRPESGFGVVLILSGLVGWLAPLWFSELSTVVIVEGVLVFISLAFVTTLARADRRAGRALNRLVAALGDRPTMADWRRAISRELGDPSVRLILRDERSRRFHEVAPMMDSTLAEDRGRRWIPIGDRAAPLAVLSIDRRAGDSPELLRAVCAATSLAIGNDHVEQELRTTIARLVAAGDSERRRVARDLHDCAQQRLLSLRIHLSLACDSLPRSEGRSKIEALCDEVDQALAEVRDVTHGLYPAVLIRYGVAAALRSASSRAALPVRVEDLGIERHDEAIEHAVYFCCLEALQNAAKHGGRHPSAVVRLTEHDGELCFEVTDDGVGFAPQAVNGGVGLVNLADRMRGVGGTLTVESAPGRGARVRGRIAVP